MKTVSTLGVIAAAACFCAAPLSLQWSPAKSPSLALDTADARIGRPLTPMSVAGVHRRAMRRTYGVGANLGYHPVARAAAIGAVAAGAGYYGAGYGGWNGGWGGWGFNRPLYSSATPGWGGGWGGWGFNRPLYSCSGPFCGAGYGGWGGGWGARGWGGGWGWRRW
jgi:hypothetical protein